MLQNFGARKILITVLGLLDIILRLKLMILDNEIGNNISSSLVTSVNLFI